MRFPSTLCAERTFANEPLTYSDVLSVRDVDQEKLEYLTRKCREVYVNTRLRTSARPEMLERADGLATTWNEAERMTIDQWHLLVPMLYEVRLETSFGPYAQLLTYTMRYRTLSRHGRSAATLPTTRPLLIAEGQSPRSRSILHPTRKRWRRSCRVS